MNERTKEILIVGGILTAWAFAMYGLNRFFSPAAMHDRMRRKEKKAREARDKEYRESSRYKAPPPTFYGEK